jgi:hypothetical protein
LRVFEGSHSDGDSVEVRRRGKHYVFRLYFVDCVERIRLARSPGGAGRYFGEGSESPDCVQAYLPEISRNKLRDPFTVYTSYGRLWILSETILPFAHL